MITVCTIITKLELGGAQEVALYTAAGLDRTKYRAVLATGPGGLLTEEAKALTGVEVEIVPSLDRSIHPVRDLRALIELVRLLRRQRPGIVHTHSSKAGILGRWAAWLAGVPVIIHTVHGFGITPAQPWWLRRLLIGLEWLTGLITTKWIVVSAADAQAGLRWGLFTREQVMLIRPGIDPRPFAAPLPAAERDRVRAEMGAEPGEPLVGMVACLKPQKAPLDFVAAAARLRERFPSARFALIGDGELRPMVEEAIRRNGLEGRVRLLGWRRDIPDVMRALDVLALTSHWEGMARVLLEARAAGVPAVATRAGGAAEAITDERHGRLCEPGDVEGFAERLGELLLVETKGRGRETLPAEFDIRETLIQCEQLYDKLLADGPIMVLGKECT